MVRRALAGLLAAVVWLLVVASPAAAHGGAVESTDYRSRITRITPRIPGLEIELVEAGGRVELTNRTSREAVVLGYEGEPYLRIGRDGVFRNRNSPATYLNARRSGGDEVPARATAEASPSWERIGDGPTARWHDHRMHWMAPRPPGVREAPEREQRLAEWLVPVDLGARRVEVRGDITYVPGPAVGPWLGGAAALAALTVLASRRIGARVTLLVAMPVLIAADVVRVTGLTFALAGDLADRVAQFVDVGLLGLVGWGLGLMAVARLARGHDDGVPAAGFAAVMLGFLGGVLEWGDLGRSQLAVAGPDDLVRLAVAVTTGLGLGVAISALLEVLQPATADASAATS